MFIATLIAAEAMRQGDISAIGDRLAALDVGYSGGCTVVQEGIACDFAFDRNPDLVREALHGAFNQTDVVVQPVAGREKRLLVADMDSTMITVECIDELADYAGLKAEVSAVTEAAMRGELDFEGALDARVALLAGLEQGVIDRCLAERVRIMPGAKALVRTMRARGGRCVLVSGGFTRFAEPVAAEIGFDRAVANRLVIENGVLTGKVEKPIVGSATKEAVLREEADDLAHAMAVGDGANDLPMIRAAGAGGGLGVAYRAKPIVAAEAGVRIEHGDLSTLLYAQGIGRADWVLD
jgi:phosphoserine phosphatase